MLEINCYSVAALRSFTLNFEFYGATMLCLLTRLATLLGKYCVLVLSPQTILEKFLVSPSSLKRCSGLVHANVEMQSWTVVSGLPAISSNLSSACDMTSMVEMLIQCMWNVQIELIWFAERTSGIILCWRPGSKTFMQHKLRIFLLSFLKSYFGTIKAIHIKQSDKGKSVFG